MSVDIAPCWALRIAGLPLNPTDGQSFDHCVERLSELDRRQAVASRAGDELADLLYQVVQRQQGPDLVGQLLELRRDAHNNRPPTRNVSQFLPEIRQALSSQECVLLDVWLEALSDVETAQQRYQASVPAAVEQAQSDRLIALRKPELLRGLAIASPSLCLSLLEASEPGRPAKRRRLRRSVVVYLTRISRKISPFSSFTTVTVQSPAGTAESVVSSVQRVALALRQTLLEIAALRGDSAELKLRGPVVCLPSPNPEACGRVFLPLRSCYDDFFYAEDYAFDVPQRLGQLVRDPGPRSLEDWLRDLECDRWALSELVAEGLLVPAMTATGLGVSANIDGQLGVDLLPVADAVAALADQQPGIRATALLQLRQRATELIAEHEGVAPLWLSSAPLAHETCATDPKLVPQVPQPSLERAMGELAEVVRPTVARSAFYDVVIEAFRALAGRAGRMALTEFIMSCISAEAMTALTTGAMQRDFDRAQSRQLTGTAEHVPLDGVGTLAPPTFTAFLQPMGQEADRWSMTVLNRVNQGPGGLLVRWGELPGCAVQLADHYAPWLQSLHPGAQIAAATSGDNWAEVQQIPDGTVPRLSWPTQPWIDQGCEPGVSAADLDVVFDPQSGSLQVEDRQSSQPVALPYLGVVPQHLLRGAGKILHCLTDPWVYDFRLGLEEGITRQAPHQPVEYLPRQSSGPMVVRRGTWRVQSAALPLVQGCALPSDADLLMEYHHWRCRHGLPRRVFIRSGDVSAASMRRNKPQFVDLADPSGLDLLLREARGGSWLTIEEALPDEDAWWPLDPGNPRVMEVTAAMALGRGRPR